MGCGQFISGSNCSCEATCEDHGNCCADYFSSCRHDHQEEPSQQQQQQLLLPSPPGTHHTHQETQWQRMPTTTAAAATTRIAVLSASSADGFRSSATTSMASDSAKLQQHQTQPSSSWPYNMRTNLTHRNIQLPNRTCRQVGCSHIGPSCACNDRCNEFRDCCEDYADICQEMLNPSCATLGCD